MILRRCNSCDHMAADFEAFSLCVKCRALRWYCTKMRLSKNRAALLHSLATSKAGRSISELVDAVYGDREDGGPLTANLCIRVTIRRLRLALFDIGAPFTIHTEAPKSNNSKYSIRLNFGNVPAKIGVQNQPHVGETRLPAGLPAIAGALAKTQSPALFVGARQ